MTSTERVDEACKWVEADPNFKQWLVPDSAVKWASLVGDMGSGKSVTFAYVADLLTAGSSTPGQVRSMACLHFCRDDAHSNQLRNIYRSLIRQMLRKAQGLIPEYKTWYDSARQESFDDPTVNPTFLQKFIGQGLAVLRRNVYLVIDGLDECDSSTRRRLVTFLDGLQQMHEHLKVFVAFRTDVDMQQEMPSGAVTVTLTRSALRDGQIVEFWVNHSLDYLLPKPKAYVIQQLTEKAQGSAIWIRLVTEYLQALSIRKLDQLKDELKGMPSPQRLADLYIKLFKQAAQGELNNKLVLLQTLQILTVAVAPLTASALGQAAVLVSGKMDDIKTTDQMQRLADPERLLHLAKAFISRSTKEGSTHATISLVHQSLNEVIRITSPVDWIHDAGDTEANVLRGQRLAAEMSVRYLVIFASESDGQDSEEDDSTQSSVASQRSEEAPPTSHEPYNISPTVLSFAQSFTVGAFYDEQDLLSSRWTQPSNTVKDLHEYVVRFWAQHYRISAPPMGSCLHDLGKELYGIMSPPDWEAQLKLRDAMPSGYPRCPGPLVVAAFYGHANILRQMLEVKEKEPLNLRCAIYWAAHQGRTECLDILLRQHNDAVDACKDDGRTPLAAAAANGHVETLSLLLKRNGSDINALDSTGRTPLSLAVESNHPKTTAVILGCQPRDKLKVNAPDRRGWTPLFWALESQSTKVLKMLLKDERVNPNALDSKRRSALSWACEGGNGDLVRTIVATLPVRLGDPDMMSNTPLIYAARSKSYDVVKALSDQHSPGGTSVRDLSISARDKSGKSALCWAASVQDERMIDALLKLAPDEATAADENGWGPVAWTMDPPGYPKNAALLLPYCKDHLNDITAGGSTILGTAIDWRQFDIAKMILEQPGCDVNQISSSGRTPLSLAASAGAIDIVKLLVETGAADATIKDQKCLSPLQYAEKEGHTAIADYLKSCADAVAGASPD
jgi:ankyrin repeat protein